MAKTIGSLAKDLVARVKARRQSTRRWFMDRNGDVHLNISSLRRRPITSEEIDAIDEAVRDFATQSRELH